MLFFLLSRRAAEKACTKLRFISYIIKYMKCNLVINYPQFNNKKMGYTKIEHNTKYLNEKAIKATTEYLNKINLKYDIEIDKIIITLPYAFFEDDQFCFDLGVTLTLIRIESNSNSEKLEFISLCLNTLKSKL